MSAARTPACEVTVRQPVTHLPDAGTHLTARTTYRQPDCMPLELLLFERVHVDLARTASACCPAC
ncbi:putative leader peptide [Streptomyces sp. NPDC001795]|uniref:putative leader peptide n=1 Tax=Streptomyces sp. NPDC001795 TaxID=3154525 RepID=UPI00332EBC2A